MNKNQKDKGEKNKTAFKFSMQKIEIIKQKERPYI